MFCSLTSSHPGTPQGCTSPDAELSVSPPGLWHIASLKSPALSYSSLKSLALRLQKCCAHVQWSSVRVRFPQPSAKQICSALGWAVQGWRSRGGCTRGGHLSGTSTSVAYTIHTILSISLISPTLVPNHPTSLCSCLILYPDLVPWTIPNHSFCHRELQKWAWLGTGTVLETVFFYMTTATSSRDTIPSVEECCVKILCLVLMEKQFLKRSQ